MGDRWFDVFEHNKQLYMVWSGWGGDTNGRQDIYIARMKDPWTLREPCENITARISDGDGMAI